MGQEGSTDEESNRVARITDCLREAVVELEVWRQNARSMDERHALHRVTALLSQAAADLRLNEALRDPDQQHLALPSAVAASVGSATHPRV